MSVPTVKREYFEKVLGKDRFAKIEASLGERAATMTDEEFTTAFKAVMAETVEEVEVDPKTEVDKADESKSLAGMKEAVIEGMKEALAPIQTSLKELTDWQATVDAKLVALEKTDDEKVAAMFGIRGLTPGTITAPVDDKDNEVDGRAMKALKTALGGNTKEEMPKSPVGPMVEMLLETFGRREPVSV